VSRVDGIAVRREVGHRELCNFFDASQWGDIRQWSRKWIIAASHLGVGLEGLEESDAPNVYLSGDSRAVVSKVDGTNLSLD
jgi:hypothetical protein